MQENNVFNFVFSSSATVYGTPRYLPLDEDHSVIGYEVTNPYGKSKYMVEHVLADLCKSDSVRFNFFLKFMSLNECIAWNENQRALVRFKKSNFSKHPITSVFFLADHIKPNSPKK